MKSMFSRIKRAYAAVSLIGLIGCGNIEQTTELSEICSSSDETTQKEENTKKQVLPLFVLSKLFLNRMDPFLFVNKYSIRKRFIDLSTVTFETYFKKISLLTEEQVVKNRSQKIIDFLLGTQTKPFEYYLSISDPVQHKQYSFALVRKLLEEKTNIKTHFDNSQFLPEKDFQKVCGLRARGCTLEKTISVLEDYKSSSGSFTEAERILTIAHEESHTFSSSSQKYVKRSQKIAEEAKAFLGTLSFDLAVRKYDQKAGDYFLLLTLKNSFEYFFYSRETKKNYEKKTFKELEAKLLEDAPKKAPTESTYEIHLPAYVLAFHVLAQMNGDVQKALEKVIHDDPEDLYRNMRKKKVSAKELYDKGLAALNKRVGSSLQVYSTDELKDIINEVSMDERLLKYMIDCFKNY